MQGRTDVARGSGKKSPCVILVRGGLCEGARLWAMKAVVLRVVRACAAGGQGLRKTTWSGAPEGV